MKISSVLNILQLNCQRSCAVMKDLSGVLREKGECCSAARAICVKRGPLAPPGQPSPQPGSSSATGDGDELNLKCQFPGWKSSFTTKTGCGVHMRRAHSDWTDEMSRTQTVKARWAQEEMSLLSRREAELSLRGVRFMKRMCESRIVGIFARPNTRVG